MGCFFIAISAFLYATKHITAAIMISYMNNPDVNYFRGGYDAVGFGITFWIVFSFLAGVSFLLGALWPLIKQRNAQTKEE